MTRSCAMEKQLFRFPARELEANNAIGSISKMGLSDPDGVVCRQGRDWSWHQTVKQPTFSLVALESYRRGADQTSYTRQDGFVKINFWLSGSHTTILDGFGQYSHDRPEIYITSCPTEMVKVDVLKRGLRMSSVSLCLLPDFFPSQMGMSVEELPEALRQSFETSSCSFRMFAITPSLSAAARAILTAPSSVRRQSLYAQAKAVELMSLLISQVAEDARPSTDGLVSARDEANIYEVRHLIELRFADEITLAGLSQAVGISRVALTNGFRKLFGLSVYDYLQTVRLNHAYELLQDRSKLVSQVAQAVGYPHSCNFSTAFKARFGFSPRDVRPRQRHR